MTEREVIDLRGKTMARGFIHWLYENGYEIIRTKENETIEERTRRIFSGASEEFIQEQIKKTKNFKPSDGVGYD